MKNYKVKEAVLFSAMQWTDMSSCPNIHKFCQSWLAKTPFGMLRVNTGNIVIKGPGNFLMVLDPDTFAAIFDEVK